MATLILDQFTDSDSTSLDAHTIAPTNTPATAWTERAGNWRITSNAAVLTANSAAAIATLNAGVADCTITVEADNSSTSSAVNTDTGVIARWTDSSNFWMITINANGDTFRIIERNAAVNTSRASASVTITPGTFYTIQVVLSGSTITATIDGGNQIQYTSATLNQTVTVHGVHARGTSDRIDDFLVETAGYTLALDTGSYTVTGQAASLLAARRLAFDAGSYTVTGQAATLLISRLLALDTGAYTLTGQDVTLTYTPLGGYTIALDAGAYSLSGQDVTLLVNRLLTPDSGAYSVTGQAAGLVVGRRLALDAGSYTVSGQAAGLVLARLLSAALGSYAVSGQAVTLVYSGAEIPVTPDTRIYVVPGEDRVFVVVLEDRTFSAQ